MSNANKYKCSCPETGFTIDVYTINPPVCMIQTQILDIEMQNCCILFI